MKSNSIIGVGLFFVAISTASVFADNSEDCPPIDPRFKEIYEELRQEEHAVLQKFKDRYPEVPESFWLRYDEIPKEVFAALKKEYPGTPACNGLPEKIDSEWSKERFGDFLKQYTECAAERNGIDPKKINIVYNPNDNERFQDSKNYSVSLLGIPYYPRLLSPYYEPAIKNNSYLLVNKDRFYQNRVIIDSMDMYTTWIDRIVAWRSNMSNKESFLQYAVERWYGKEELTQPHFKKLIEELLNLLYEEHSFIIAAMNSKDVMNRVIQYASNDEQVKIFNPSYNWKKILAYALKIKNIIQKGN